MTGSETPSETDQILVEIVDGVATLTLNRPDVLNALTFEMRIEYTETLRRLDRDPEVRVIVVTGAGRGFCSGADTSVFADAANRPAHLRSTLENLPTVALGVRKPVVAAVNGAAAGIGFAIMLCADVVFVAEDAKLVTSFARLGLVAEHGTGWLLPRVVGHARATEILLSGRVVLGSEAAQIGLAVAALPKDEVLAAAQAWAADVASSCSPWALATIKRQLHSDSVLPMESAVQRSLPLMEESLSRPDITEALAARREKRPPHFNPQPER
jgi:enoyl-CoA hydratase/carnithine racemase